MAIVLKTQTHKLQIPKRIEATAEFDLEGFREFVFRCALAICGEPDGAEDVSQEVLLILNRSQRQIESADQPLAWIRKVTGRAATRYLQRQRRTVTLHQTMMVKGTMNQGVEILQILQKLSPEHRALLGMAMGQGLTYQEIAEVLGVPEGTVGSRLNAAKRAFQQEWER